MSTEAGEKIRPFVGKLWAVLEDKTMPDAIQWDSDGKGVEIKVQKCDDDKLKQELGIQISTLDRQLRQYHFKKNAKTSQGGKLVYSNPYFQKGRPEFLSHIKRQNFSKKTNASVVNANKSLEERKSVHSFNGQDPRKQIRSSQNEGRVHDQTLNIPEEPLNIKVEEEMSISHYNTEEEKSDLQKGNSDPKTWEENDEEIVSKVIIEKDALVDGFVVLKHQKDNLEEDFKNLDLFVTSWANKYKTSQLLCLQQQQEIEELKKLCLQQQQKLEEKEKLCLQQQQNLEKINKLSG